MMSCSAAHPGPLAHRAGCALVLAGLLACVAPGESRAQTLRDPTRPPARVAGPAAGAEAAPAPPDTGPVTVIVRDGQPYLVVGTRLYAQGQMLGTARIERIGETEVWLREGRTLHRKPVFTGIVRHTVGAPPVRPVCPTDTAGAAPSQRRPGTAVSGRKTVQQATQDDCKP